MKRKKKKKNHQLRMITNKKDSRINYIWKMKLAYIQWRDYYFVGINGLGIILEYLEFDSRLLDVDYLVGTKSSFLWGY